MSDSPDRDGQEGAETLDTFLDDDGAGDAGRTFEECPQVEDLTRARHVFASQAGLRGAQAIRGLMEANFYVDPAQSRAEL